MREIGHMFSTVFMKILEGRPRTYDRWMNRVTRGRVASIKQMVAAEVPHGSRVLEIGCGTGELAALLVERDCSVDGFDVNPGMVEVARKRIESEDLGDRFVAHEMSVDGMDTLPASRFDVVVATLVFSELSDDERRFGLKHATRVLKPGGILVIADEVRPRPAGKRILQALARAPAVALTYLVSRETTYPIDDLPGEMERAGFTLEKEVLRHGGAFALVVGRSLTDGGKAEE